MGLDRWIVHDYHLHNGLCVDEWELTSKQVCCDGEKRRCWRKTGKMTCFDFSVAKVLNPLVVLGLALFPGQVTETPLSGRSLIKRNPSGCKADYELLMEMRRQVGDPPLYSLLFFNCNHWVARYYNYGTQFLKRMCACHTCD